MVSSFNRQMIKNFINTFYPHMTLEVNAIVTMQNGYKNDDNNDNNNCSCMAAILENSMLPERGAAW